jgi:bifunctional non-homologous end joining protein LigD
MHSRGCARGERAGRARNGKRGSCGFGVKPGAIAPTARRIPVITYPEAPTLIAAPFDDDAWLFEVKWDGVRAVATIDARGTVALRSRNGLELLRKYPGLRTLARSFSARPVVVDGEIVALDPSGRSSFQLLQRHQGEVDDTSDARLRFAVFDLLYHDGHDLRRLPLEERKRLLASIVRSGGGAIYSKHVIGKGKALFEAARRRHLEGIVGKRRDSPYLERRTRDWVKIKTGYEQEVVVGGWTEGRGSRVGFGALLMGYYEGANLRYAGSVGTGFDRETLLRLRRKLDALATARCPFTPAPPVARAHWVRPSLVVEVRFEEWTDAGLMRQPAFLGVREDKAARDVVRERPVR